MTARSVPIDAAVEGTTVAQSAPAAVYQAGKAQLLSMPTQVTFAPAQFSSLILASFRMRGMSRAPFTSRRIPVPSG